MEVDTAQDIVETLDRHYKQWLDLAYDDDTDERALRNGLYDLKDAITAIIYDNGLER